MSDFRKVKNTSFEDEDITSTRSTGAEIATGFNSTTSHSGSDQDNLLHVEFEGAGQRMQSGAGGTTSHNNGHAETIAKQFFSKKPGVFEHAMEEVSKQLMKNFEGEVLGAWLLTEIDHWDNNHERLVLLCEHSLVVARYDFVAVKALNFRRIPLYAVNTVLIGNIVYPEKSVMPVREHVAVRVAWGQRRELSLAQKWNPWCSDIPYTTFAHHPLLHHSHEAATQYDVNAFYEALAVAVRKEYQNKKQESSSLTVERGPIRVESYASVSSMIFNQSHLGYSLERGGISF